MSFHKAPTDALDREYKERKGHLRRLEREYSEILDKCSPNPVVQKNIVEFIDCKLINDPFVVNSLFPNGMTRALHAEYVLKLDESYKNKETRQHNYGIPENVLETEGEADRIAEAEDDDPKKRKKSISKKTSQKKGTDPCCAIF